MRTTYSVSCSHCQLTATPVSSTQLTTSVPKFIQVLHLTHISAGELFLEHYRILVQVRAFKKECIANTTAAAAQASSKPQPPSSPSDSDNSPKRRTRGWKWPLWREKPTLRSAAAAAPSTQPDSSVNTGGQSSGNTGKHATATAQSAAGSPKLRASSKKSRGLGLLDVTNKKRSSTHRLMCHEREACPVLTVRVPPPVPPAVPVNPVLEEWLTGVLPRAEWTHQ